MFDEPERKTTRSRRRELTDEFLQHVAEIYRSQEGPSRHQAIAEYYGTSLSTAAYYVQRAREKGFLGPALEGRAGEQDPSDDTVRRVTGGDRDKLVAEFKRRYESGESVRALAASTGRSYGFVHRVLTEAGVQLRGRGV